MARLNITDTIGNVDPGDYLVSVQLKTAAGIPVGASADAPVTVPVPADVPVFDPPTVTVEA